MRRILFATVMLVTVPSSMVWAGPLFSVDPASAPVPMSANDILLPGPAVAIPEAALGLGLFDNLNALSFGRGGGVPVFFSVDRGAIGAPGSAVAAAAPAIEQADDIFSIGPALGTNSLFAAGSALGLEGGFFGDDLDALSFNMGPVPFFSFDAFSAVNSFGVDTLANDIFIGSTATAFASGEADIGLDPFDDLDALILDDQGTPGVLDPGLDTAYFSLSFFSPSTFTGGAGAFSPGDILVTDFTGGFGLYAPAAAIGLDPFDELNALSNPEPGSLALLSVGLAGFAVQRRRKQKQAQRQAEQPSV